MTDFVAAAGQDDRRADRDRPVTVGFRVAVELGDVQLGAVPRHVGVVPLEPGQMASVGADAGCGDEVGARHQDGGLVDVAAGPGPHGHDLVARLGVVSRDRDGMVLADADDPPGVGGEPAVGVAVAVLVGRLGGEGERMVGTGVETPQPLVGPVREHQVGLVQPPGPTAVLVHPGAGGEALGQHVDPSTAGPVAHELHPSTLLRARLGPPHVDHPDRGLADRDALRHDQLGGDRRRPAAVGPLGHVPSLSVMGLPPSPGARPSTRSTGGKFAQPVPDQLNQPEEAKVPPSGCSVVPVT